MIRLGALFWLLLVVAAGFVTFKVKYAVQDLEDELNRVKKQTVAEQQEIRVLSAEWTYLNQPERLAHLNRRFLQLAPIGPKQLQQKVEDIPLRPPPLPAEPDVVIAKAEPPLPAPVLAAPGSEPAPAPPAPASSVSALAALTIGQASASELPGGAAGPKPIPARPMAPVRFAKAAAAAPHSLDELFSQVAETR